MLAMRSFVRALPRASLRAAPVRSLHRQISIPRTSILSRATTYKSFSTAQVWRASAGDSDAELSAKLDYERTMEESETKNPAALPQELDDFLTDSSFSIQDQPGTENVILTKKFGNETIRVECSISDVNDQQDAADLDDDLVLGDEPDFAADNTSGGKKTINQSGVRGGKVDMAPEDSIAPSDREGGEDMPEETSAFPLNLSITIDKGSSGATNVIASATDGQIEIEYVHFYPRAELIDPKTPEASKEAQNVYGGPSFPYLDLELQQMYEQYLQERGINEQLFWFLTRYVEYKEQREYVQWLQNMKKFIDA